MTKAECAAIERANEAKDRPKTRTVGARNKVRVTGYGVVRNCSDAVRRAESKRQREDYIIGHQVKLAYGWKGNR